jgi:hypothetical protein
LDFSSDFVGFLVTVDSVSILAPVDFNVHAGSLDEDECKGLFCLDTLVDALAVGNYK